MSAHFEISSAAGGKYQFHLKAGNGRIVLASELYSAKSGAENGVSSVKANSSLDERYERMTSVADEPYFVLKAANGEVIGQSQMYASLADMEEGLASVKTNGASAPVVDMAATS